MFAIYFGLVVLAMSLSASTAFAASTQVLVTNTPQQPVPMVGLTTDNNAPGRKPFQTAPIYVPAPLVDNSVDVVTVPANQRLVIEYVSGFCTNISYAYLASYTPQLSWTGVVFLPKDFYDGHLPGSSPVRIYSNPGETLKIKITNQTGYNGSCYLTVAGYFVSLP